MVVVPVVLSMQEILNNEGDAQLLDVYDTYISAAEKSLEDTMDAAHLLEMGPRTAASRSRASRPPSR